MIRTDRRPFGTQTPFLLLVIVLLGARAASLDAMDHSSPYGEPYELAGKRLVFTSWYMVRPGQFDWQDDLGKSVYANRSVMAKADDPHTHWKELDLPHGIRIVAERATKHELKIETEQPWEAGGIEIQAMFQREDKIMAWGTCQPGGNCYFESKDGDHWTRPELGLVEFEGNKQNNLVPSLMGRICYDPSAPPAERFKAASNSDYELEEFEKYKQRRPWQVMATETDPGRVHAVFGYVSPDGHQWTRLPDPISVEMSDGGQYIYFDPRTKKYVMYLRAYMVGPRAIGYPLRHQRWHQFAQRRAIGRSETSDFRAFPLSEVVIDTSLHMAPTDTFYFCTYTTVPHAPDHHLMFPSRYQQAKDAAVIDLYTSYDGKMWDIVPGSPVLSPGNYGQWDGGTVWMPNMGLVEFGDGSWVMPFRGDPLPHKYPRGYYAERWGLAVWPKGRLIALEATDEGRFTSMAFLAPGKKMRVNALTERTGEVLIEAADLNGKPLPGRTFDDAVPIVGDQYMTEVRWNDAADLGVETGEPIVLRFRLKQAKLYCLDFE
jgi:hypothetical protein